MRKLRGHWYVIGMPPGGEVLYLVAVLPEDAVDDAESAIAGVRGGEFGDFFRRWILRCSLIRERGKAFEGAFRALLRDIGIDDRQAAALARTLRANLVSRRR